MKNRIALNLIKEDKSLLYIGNTFVLLKLKYFHLIHDRQKMKKNNETHQGTIQTEIRLPKIDDRYNIKI